MMGTWVVVALTPTVFWHVDCLGMSEQGTPLVHNNGGVLDVADLGLPYKVYVGAEVREYAQAALLRAVEQHQAGQQ